ncbi:hypothetical protein [Nocardia sp. CS682]|uniref:hypothetical protein n=1 Tax=Nocardia sp. CS682 TaxID=1047172 RepID=UPI00107587E2|nr:hypothetical protein [Nocardia sp. CS682]
MSYLWQQRAVVVDKAEEKVEPVAQPGRRRPVVLRDKGLSERLERLYDVKVDDDRRMRRLVHERRQLQGDRERSCGCGLRQHRIANPSAE